MQWLVDMAAPCRCITCTANLLRSWMKATVFMCGVQLLFISNLEVLYITIVSLSYSTNYFSQLPWEFFVRKFIYTFVGFQFFYYGLYFLPWTRMQKVFCVGTDFIAPLRSLGRVGYYHLLWWGFCWSAAAAATLG